MKKFELVFIPLPVMGHLAAMVEMANILVTRDQRLTVTILVIKLPLYGKTAEYIQSLSASFASESMRFIILPEVLLPEESEKEFMLKAFLESYKPIIREAIIDLTDSQMGPDSPRLAGFVLDMFCTTMIDVANEFGVPSYVFCTSNAGFLALSFHLQELYDENNSKEVVKQLQNSNAEIALPSFVNPIPGKMIPDIFSNDDTASWFHDQVERYRSGVKGILINTFAKLESHVMNSMSRSSSSRAPPLYSIGPILHLKNNNTVGPGGTLHCTDILKWLDNQPPVSVVFLCFGSMGSFDEDQVKEIAHALERSGVRFLWSLRQPPPKDKFEAPSEYTDIKYVLPEGFLERTAGIGRVIGWAPQVEILAHPATGGFVSHCGWNSTLESMWHGVPMATWPLYAEQQFTAFEMVVELGLAVDITLDYQKHPHGERSRVVSAEEIQSGIRKLMEEGGEMRKKVKAKSEESRKSLMEGGSSFISLGRFIDDVLGNGPEGGE
uniref:Glycosyltransferase n=1 Tax=Siraitia grosvenorii TaxID=190515 RepID=K7NBW4_SIRGR|nr:UDP-glucosyltransferase [Siraitia grosvenorii]